MRRAPVVTRRLGRLGAPATAAMARAADRGCAGQGHGGRNTLWRSGDDEGKQRWYAAAFDGDSEAPAAGNVFGEALQHKADEGVSGGLI
jgi:hypothetical protein